MATAASAARKRLGEAWNRIPSLARRGIVFYTIYRGYEFVQHSDTLYKLFNPGRHALGSTILDLDLTSVELVAHDGARSNSPLVAGEQLSVPRIVSTLRAAREDPRVAGLVCRGIAGLRGSGIAEISEIRRAVQDFSSGSGGKPTMLHLPEGIGSAGNGTIPLYFASAFDSAHVQPTSPVIVPGLSFGSLFFRGTLDKLGVLPVKVARKEYKTAADSFTESSFTDANRESTEALLDSIMSTITEGISEGRGIPKDRVSEAFDEAVMTAPDAVSRGLLDACAYRDELPQIMRKALADGEARRREERIGAEREWGEAMSGILAAWDANDKAEASRWADGTRLNIVDSFADAVQFAIEFCDPTRDGGNGKDVLEAELRALRAHLKWIDTRPWEAIPKHDSSLRSKHTVMGLGNAYSIVALERRMCVEAIAALENMPEEKAAATAKAKNGQIPLELKDVKRLLRWTRAMWRSKTLCARFVGSLKNVPDPKGEEIEEGSRSTEAVSGIGPCAPRLFLAHEEGEPALNSHAVAALQNVDDQKKKSRLRYVRLTEYLDTLSQEHRAVYKREGSWVRGRTARADIGLKGVSESEYFGGTVDQSERVALTHLCDYKTPFIQPWRLSSTRNSPTIAVINVDGAISDDGAEEVRGAIRRANKDIRVHGIVLRVDSPGGSATASDLIARSVEICSKPTVASMSNVCASGGVFITAPCDKIFAEEGTITGSIGVIFTTFLPIGLFEKLGITVDTVERGRFAKFFGAAGSVTEWDEGFRKRIDAMIDDMYKSFVDVASRGRGKSFDEIESIARGRVWSGTDAKRLGLIDDIGGLEEAALAAAELAGGEPGVRPHIVSYPTTADKLESRLRRIGVLRSRLDEEGDEAVPKEKKSNRRRRRWAWVGGGEEDEGDEETDTNDEVDENSAGSGNSDNGDVGDGGSDDPPGDESGSRSPFDWFSSGGGEVGGRSGAEAIFRFAGEEVGDLSSDFVTSLALWALSRCDDFILRSDSHSWSARTAEYALGAFLRLSGAGRAVEAELSALSATAGRPAMVMSPQIHSALDSGKD